jgi:hypothetical protein
MNTKQSRKRWNTLAESYPSAKFDKGRSLLQKLNIESQRILQIYHEDGKRSPLGMKTRSKDTFMTETT